MNTAKIKLLKEIFDKREIDTMWMAMISYERQWMLERKRVNRNTIKEHVNGYKTTLANYAINYLKSKERLTKWTLLLMATTSSGEPVRSGRPEAQMDLCEGDLCEVCAP